jgi:iron-sulfur cluster assembly protein
MIQVSDTAKRKLSTDEDGFDAATDYVRVGVKWWMPGLSYDLKFDKPKAKTKIFIDNEITIA